MKKLLLISSFSLLFHFSFSQWRVIPNAPAVSRFDDASFINDSTGWIAQGYDMYKTTDAGETWQHLSTLPVGGTGYIRSIEFLNDQVGFYGTIADNNNQAKIYKTIDGGLSFNEVTSVLLDPDDGMCGMAHYGNTIIAVGTWSSFTPHFYKSTDAGLNWEQKDLSTFGQGLVDCHMFDQNNYVVCGTSSSLNHAFIARTSDGGDTWQQVAYCSTPGISYMWKMFFLDNGVGFASVQNHPIIYKTTDYGYTWQQINLGLATATGLGAIGALNDSVIWVGNQFSNGMYGTKDGGQTWIQYPVFGENMDRMVRLDNNHLLCVGSTVYKYTNESFEVPIDSSLISQHHFVTVKPNPFSSQLKIHMELFQSSYILLDVVDIYGHIIKRLHAGTLPGGINDKNFFLDDLSSGVYTLLFRSNEEFKNIKVMKD